MTAKVRDLDRLGDVLDGLVAAGANEVHGRADERRRIPRRRSTRRCASAIAAARAKAKRSPTPAASTLGGLTRVEEEAGGAVPPMPRMRMMAAVAMAEGSVRPRSRPAT